MKYTKDELLQLQHFYKGRLLGNTIPFWFPRSYDLEHNGFLLMRDADGSLIDDDKSVWFQGRATWILATLYNTVSPKQEWLEGAQLGHKFLSQKCFDSDGKMFFHMTREGDPIRKRRYFFSETFAVIAYAAYAKASGSEEIAEQARELFGKCINYAKHPEEVTPKFTNVRPSMGIGVPVIMLNTARQVLDTIGDPRALDVIDQCIGAIRDHFVKDDIGCVMEEVAPDGSIIDHINGRMLNPGHAIEGAWFILNESRIRGNAPELISLGCRMLDYMWERGWDNEYGGIFYYRDVYKRPVQEYWHDMKFWWPHNETIIATLLAFVLTDNEKYARWHRLVHDYSYSQFSDPQHGEWFGYLHRDGTVTQTAKGNIFKGPFHLPRQEWYCMRLLGDYGNKI